jgi:hypothetical protein
MANPAIPTISSLWNQRLFRKSHPQMALNLAAENATKAKQVAN